MAVDPRAVDEMARIRRILNGEYEQETTDVAQNYVMESKSIGSGEIGVNSDPTADMKEIMRRFNQGATKSVERITESSDTDRSFASALVTEKTQTGVKVGSWEIKVYEDAGNKTYDICHIHTDEPIARDLTLYESALTISKLLNSHVSINSHQIRDVLSLEESYSAARNEAALFKRKARRMNESNNLFEAHVADDRYQESRRLAIKFRDKIISMSKSL